jgi:CheY-like chemotaxis protein
MDSAPLLQVSVLVVEDHDDTREFVRFVLVDAGALVQSAATALEAERLLRVATPDVVVVDLDLPGEDGYWLLARVRALDVTSRVRMIAATAHVSEDERALALSAGFDAFLVKPFVPDQLVRMIARLAPREWR